MRWGVDCLDQSFQNFEISRILKIVIQRKKTL